ncbi:MAG: hypothetical protein U0K19_05345 [Bifidobacteriaceae bacterium]|nr:hypothetical protein [Bifidobacteriaceae bacterium]
MSRVAEQTEWGQVYSKKQNVAVAEALERAIKYAKSMSCNSEEMAHLIEQELKRRGTV